MNTLSKTGSDIIYELKTHNYTIATFESCTGGGMVNTLTNIAGASAYVKGGFVGYSIDTKTTVGHINLPVIKDYGVVSNEVAQAMANKACENFKADVGISATGNLIPIPSPNTACEVYCGIRIKNKYYSLHITDLTLANANRSSMKDEVITIIFKHLLHLLKKPDLF